MHEAEVLYQVVSAEKCSFVEWTCPALITSMIAIRPQRWLACQQRTPRAPCTGLTHFRIRQKVGRADVDLLRYVDRFLMPLPCELPTEAFRTEGALVWVFSGACCWSVGRYDGGSSGPPS